MARAARSGPRAPRSSTASSASPTPGRPRRRNSGRRGPTTGSAACRRRGRASPARDGRSPSASPTSTAAAPTQTSPVKRSSPVEPGAAARPHLVDEVRVDRRLQALQPLHVLRPLGAERVEQALVLAGGVDPALDAVPGDQVLEAEGGRDHPDRADDAVGVEMDPVGRGRQPVAARGGDVLDEGVHRHLLLVGQPADPGGDQARLRRAAAGRVDRERHRLRPAAAERRLDQRREAGVGQRRARRARARPDHPLEPQHGHRSRRRSSRAGSPWPPI